MHLLTKIQAIVQNGPYGNYLFYDVDPSDWYYEDTQWLNPTAMLEDLYAYGEEQGLDLPFYHFEGMDLSPEKLATADADELGTILESYLGEDSEEYEKYFAAFDPQKIADIEANLENKMSQLGVQHQAKLRAMQQQIKGVTGQVGGATQSYKTSVSQRGFEGAGDIASRLQKQKKDLFGQQKSLFGGMAAEKESYGLAQEGLGLEASMDKRSAYEDYMDKFYSQLGNVQTMISEED